MSFESELQTYFAKKKHVETNIHFPENFRELLATANKNYGDKTAVNFFDQVSKNGVGMQLTFSELHNSCYQRAHG